MREYINIKNVGNNNGEILNKFNWDIEFVYPSISFLYKPSMDILKGRLISVNGLPAEQSTSIEEAEVGGGFSVIQIGANERKPFTLNLEFQDYDDEQISYFFTNWSNLNDNPFTRVSNYKRDMVCQAVIYQLDTALDPVKRWKCRNGLLEQYGTGDSDFGNKKEISGKVTAGIKFEWWDVEYRVLGGGWSNGIGLSI